MRKILNKSFVLLSLLSLVSCSTNSYKEVSFDKFHEAAYDAIKYRYVGDDHNYATLNYVKETTTKYLDHSHEDIQTTEEIHVELRRYSEGYGTYDLSEWREAIDIHFKYREYGSFIECMATDLNQDFLYSNNTYQEKGVHYYVKKGAFKYNFIGHGKTRLEQAGADVESWIDGVIYFDESCFMTSEVIKVAQIVNNREMDSIINIEVIYR